MVDSSTEVFAAESVKTPETRSVTSLQQDALMDYTTVPVGWQIQGSLSTGHVTKATVLCLHCAQVGLLAIKNGKSIIVHRGRASDKTLHAVEYCEDSLTQH